MKRNWHLLISLSVVLVTSGQGALQFTNVSSAGFSSTLNAVAGDNQSNFVAVGQSTLGLSASFNLTAWASSPVVTNALGDGSLFGLTYGAGRFVAGGVNASTFFSSDRTNWVRGSKANSLQVTIPALTYNPNNGRFASVGLFPLASWSTDVATSWPAGNLTAPVSPFFSFHGVAAFGTSSFVTCGDSGTIRISSDGGLNWGEVNPNVGSDFSLRAVASDGNQQLVAVGNSGRVLYSANGGTTWQTNSWIASGFGSLTLNAVAFMNPGYIVVGEGGRVFTIADITTTNWTVSTTTSASLLGVAFGTANSVQGVAVIVGASGTIIVGSEPPLAPLNVTAPVVNCAGGINGELRVEVTNSLNAAFVTADWFLDAAGTMTLTNDSLRYLPTNQVAGTFTNYVRARDLRTGIVSAMTNVTFVVNPLPLVTSVTATPQTNCLGQPITVRAFLGGSAGPWNVMWSDGINQAGVASPATRTITPPVGNTIYRVTNLVDVGSLCLAAADGVSNSVTVTVLALPAANAGTNRAICLASSTVIGGNPTASGGSGGYSFVWTPATGLDSTTVANPTATPAATTIYTVTVTDSASCTSAISSVTVTVNPLPNPPVSGGDKVGCAGVANPTLSVTVGGGETADWYLTSVGGLPVGTGITYPPTNQTAGSFAYFAEARNLATGCLSPSRTAVTLTLQTCTNALTVTSQNGTNVVLEWFGNLTLQSATDLTPPISWQFVTTGSAGVTNRLTNSVIPPPNDKFFRLTNAP